MKEERFVFQWDDYDCVRSIYDSEEDCEYHEWQIESITDLLNQQDQRIAELEEQLEKSLESNNDLLKQIMELEAQLIKERLKGENK